MDLRSIIYDAIGGFIAGFAMGISGYLTKKEEQIAKVDAILTDEEKSRIKDYEKNTSKIRWFNKISPWTNSYMLGVFYSATTTLIGTSALGDPFTKSFIISFPAAYIGIKTGGLARKLAGRREKDEIDIAKSIKENPESFLSYIPLIEKEKIQGAIAEISEKVLQGDKETEESLKNGTGSVKELWDLILNENKVYSPLLAKLSIKKLNEITEDAFTERVVRRFYEESAPMKQVEAPSIVLAVTSWGEETKKTTLSEKIRVYDFDGYALRVYNAQWNSDQFALEGELERKPDLETITTGHGEKPNIITKTIAKDINKNKDCTNVLMHSLPGIPNEEKHMALASAIVMSLTTLPGKAHSIMFNEMAGYNIPGKKIYPN